MSGYGLSKYGTGGYKCQDSDQVEKLHYYALKKIFPIKNIGGDFDNDLDIEGWYLDDAYFRAGYKKEGLHDQFFPDTVTELLYGFQNVFGLTSTGSSSEVIAKMRALINKDSKLGTNYYKTYIDTFLNLTPGTTTITENHDDMFVCGDTIPPATALSHKLYEEDWNWTWTITTSNPGALPATKIATLKEDIERLKPAFTLVIWAGI
jgi:uncharacterized protein YmfQ (DUF2313 family)